MTDLIDVGPIDKAQFEKYLALHAEADEIWKKIAAHGLQIARALSGADVDKVTGTNGVMVFYDTRFDEVGSFKVELLFDQNWRNVIQEALDRRARAWEERRRREQAEDRKRTEEKERAQLAELLKKYPDSIPKTEPSSSTSSTPSAASTSTPSPSV